MALDDAACSRCGGRGWIVEADGGAGTARPCDCRQSRVVPTLEGAAGIPQRYLRCSFDKFQVTLHGRRQKGLEEARNMARDYVDGFPMEYSEVGLLFTGPPGVGKTHLAVATLLELIRRYRVRGRFIDFTTLIYEIRSSFDPGSPESNRSILDPVMGTEVLVLDELGAQKPTPWVSEILYLLLNTRYTRRLPTIFTTNYRLSASKEAELEKHLERSESGFDLLENRIPAMLVSRLYEMSKPVTIDSEDYRKLVFSV